MSSHLSLTRHALSPHVGTLSPLWGLEAINGPLCSTCRPIRCTHTAVQLLKSLVLRALCMIVTGQAWGLISAVSPSKALAVYSGLQGGRQGLSLPRHNARPPPSQEPLQQGWQLVWASHREARLTGSRIWPSTLHESQHEKLNMPD